MGPGALSMSVMKHFHPKYDAEFYLQANYSAFFDRERILVKSSARSNELKFRQLLFQMAFNDSGPHRLSLTVVHDGANQWFDIDFVTVTMNGTALNGPYVTTLSLVPVMALIFHGDIITEMRQPQSVQISNKRRLWHLLG